jgi:hypothetical protein
LQNLENNELLNILLDDCGGDLTVNNVARRLEFLWSQQCDCWQAIAFAALHFHDLPISDLDLISSDIELISAVLSNESLKLVNEDSLLAFLSGLFARDAAYFSLFEFVHFEYLSPSGIAQFIELLSDSLPLLTISIWRRICNRLSLSVHPGLPDRTLEKTRHAALMVLQSDDPFVGIIHHLTAECGGNVCDCGIICVTAAHTDPKCYKPDINGGTPKVVFDFDSRVGWYDDNRDPSWLQIDFRDRRILVTSYSINFGQTAQSHPQQWILLGSQDAVSWTTVDDRSGESKHRPSFNIETFVCRSDSSEAFRYLRLFKKGMFWGHYYYFGLTALKFFESLTIAPSA